MEHHPQSRPTSQALKYVTSVQQPAGRRGWDSAISVNPQDCCQLSPAVSPSLDQSASFLVQLCLKSSSLSCGH